MRAKTFSFDQDEKRQLRNILAEIMRDLREVEFAYLYGSLTEDLPFHDVDLGIYLAAINEKETTSYAINLAQKLSTKLGLPIDVRLLNFAPTVFLYQVFRGELIFERNEGIRSSLVERTVQKYLDQKNIIYRSIKEAFVF